MNHFFFLTYSLPNGKAQIYTMIHTVPVKGLDTFSRSIDREGMSKLLTGTVCCYGMTERLG